MKVNKELFNRVKNFILKEPTSYNQGFFGRANGENACGVEGCIAGTALFLENPPLFVRLAKAGEQEKIRNLGCRLLGVSVNSNIFAGASGWPRQFSKKYFRDNNPTVRAKVAAKRINHFLRTGK